MLVWGAAAASGVVVDLYFSFFLFQNSTIISVISFLFILHVLIIYNWVLCCCYISGLFVRVLFFCDGICNPTNTSFMPNVSFKLYNSYYSWLENTNSRYRRTDIEKSLWHMCTLYMYIQTNNYRTTEEIECNKTDLVTVGF